MPATAKEKPRGRLPRAYRLMWDQNHPYQSHYHPPMPPDTIAQAHLGYFAGTAVDANVCALGPDAGYVTAFKSEKTRMEYLVDRYERGAALGHVRYWRHGENLKRSLADGVDPLQVQLNESQRLGVDHWFRLSMNDWHHFDADQGGAVYRLGGSEFYETRPDLLIGEAGAAGWADHPHLHRVIPWMQDFAHDEVRALRRDIALEVCERYDCTGFLFDFMRMPVCFGYGQELANAHLLTQLVRETREGLDEIGRHRGKPLGLAVRVPPTVAGATRAGMDVQTWVAEHLVDVLVTCPLFAQDTEHDVGEWVALGGATPVQVIAGLEEGYIAGHNDGFNRWFYEPPLMTPLTMDTIRGLAARHHARGIDGLYVFNWFAAAVTYDSYLLPALDDVADPERLRFMDKRYLLMRSTEQFPNCLDVARQIPAELDDDGAAMELTFDVADDVPAAPDLVRSARLLLNVLNLTIADQLEVTFNGRAVSAVNQMQPGTLVNPQSSRVWQIYDLADASPQWGANLVTVRAATRNHRMAAEMPLSIQDAEIEVRYLYPTGSP